MAMANKRPSRLAEHVVVNQQLITGYVTGLTNIQVTVFLDDDGNPRVETPEQIFDIDRVWALTWKESRLNGSFIYKAKSWRDFKGNRKIRVQAHLIRNGVIGRRIVLQERKNGKIIRAA